jgi:hypothetical protein
VCKGGLKDGGAPSRLAWEGLGNITIHREDGSFKR